MFVENVDIGTSLRSDHSIITLNFYKSETTERGPSFWHFNANLLKDKKYIDEINNRITDAIRFGVTKTK